MKFLNIYIEKSRLTQFHGINQIQVDGYLLNILDSYNIGIRNGKLETNIDIFLIGHHNTYLELSEFQHLLGNRLVYVKQHKKSSNLASLNAYIDCAKYIPANVHGCINMKEDWSEYIFAPSVYYVKPEYGARSLNQFIVDSSKVSIGHFLQKLKSFDEAKDKQAQYIADLVAQANGHIKHIKGHERFENEHASLKSQFCVHKCIPNIKKEFRVINVGFGKKLYFLERIRNDENNGVISNEINYVQSHETPSLEISVSLQLAFEATNFFHGSVDLVITDDGRWSIIETSNQFGGGDIQAHTKNEIMTQTLMALVKHAEMMD